MDGWMDGWMDVYKNWFTVKYYTNNSDGTAFSEQMGRTIGFALGCLVPRQGSTSYKLNVHAAKFIHGICQLASFSRPRPAFHPIVSVNVSASNGKLGWGQRMRVLLQYSMQIRMLLAEDHS